MKTHPGIVALGLAGWLVAAAAHAGEKKKDVAGKNPATTPAPRDKGWMSRHDKFIEIAKRGGVDVLFLGDSITDAWGGEGHGAKSNGTKEFEKRFVPLKAANFGIGGDRTQHVLWRIQHGELDGIQPKVVMLMIGTNNVGSDSAAQIADGITAIVKTIHKKSPATKVLLLAVFPRDPQPNTKNRMKIADINQRISKLDKLDYVKYLDIGSKFTKEDGTLTKDIMPDYLHLSPQGYTIWADAVEPSIRALLGGRKE
jgi:lysophospholipase L1-like esterase